MNIYPIFDTIQSRSHKEQQLQQRGVTLWFTGLSGSGKSTIAAALEQSLCDDGYFCCILDGDNLRHGINSDLGFLATERQENIRRTAEICRLMTQNGIITIACLVSPTTEVRELARNIIGSQDMVEIYISTPLAECERRDVKGLYAAARRGDIANFTGLSAPFEPPQHPDITIDTTDTTVESCAEVILQNIKPRIVYEL